jgi:taurine dioxygenase
METRRLGEDFGAEVVGCEFGRGIPDDTAAELRRLLDEYRLLVFRDADLDVDQHVAIMQAFGRPCAEGADGRPWSVLSNVEADTPGVFRRPSDNDGFQSRLLFHQDYVWSPLPHTHLSLYGSRFHGEVADTVFASNERGYRTLTDEQRRRFADLHVMNAFQLRKERASDEARRNRITDLSQIGRYGRTVQPMIKAHPRAGTPLLFVTELFTSHVVELGLSDQGEEIIQEAYAALYSDQAFYRHEWRERDLVVWDNLALQHARGPVVAGTRRTFRRVAINDSSLEDVFAAAQGSGGR